ncbi:hypothetical protein TNIN_111051 [Trichonephila inaurata madagascariensis]|uniref:Uncharacterized protein n=1 Tax=Trichonephila inaurata madagascariensis TaxID=2747483 RepID=A0A8X6XDQ2_9ARAC|nr:hypothetical protein TNIN_111051 [Trichonephila inaurata madagascariensis]
MKSLILMKKANAFRLLWIFSSNVSKLSISYILRESVEKHRRKKSFAKYLDSITNQDFEFLRIDCIVLETPSLPFQAFLTHFGLFEGYIPINRIEWSM